MKKFFVLFLILLCCALCLTAGAETIKIPANTTAIHAHAFLNATKVTDIELPDGLTSIGEKAFYGTSVTSVTLPASLSLSEIGTNAFPENTWINGSQEGLNAWAAENGYHHRAYYALLIGQTYKGVDYFEE